MKWTTLITADDTQRNGILAESVDTQIIKSRGKLSPYIEDCSYLVDSDGYMVIRLNVTILNKSQSDAVVNQVLLSSREDEAFTLTPSRIRPAWRGNARVRLDDRRLYDICGNDEILTLPSTIKSGATIKGWLAFVIDSNQVKLISKYNLCTVVVDQRDKQYKSKAEQDQSIDPELVHRFSL